MSNEMVDRLRSLYDRMSAAGIILVGTEPERLFTFEFGDLRIHVRPTTQSVQDFVLFCADPALKFGQEFTDFLFNLRASRLKLGDEYEYCVLWSSDGDEDSTIALGKWMHLQSPAS